MDPVAKPPFALRAALVAEGSIPDIPECLPQASSAISYGQRVARDKGGCEVDALKEVMRSLVADVSMGI